MKDRLCPTCGHPIRVTEIDEKTAKAWDKIVEETESAIKAESYKLVWESLKASLRNDMGTASNLRESAVSNGDMGRAISRDSELRTLTYIYNQMIHLECSEKSKV
jgi:uncharacterized Zn finger protein (UPF0148 family)